MSITTDIQNNLVNLEKNTLDKLTSIDNAEDLSELRTQLLGRNGELTQILRSIGDLNTNERKLIGQASNALKNKLEHILNEKNTELISVQPSNLESLDVSLPGKYQPIGRLHPITQTLRQILDVLRRLGFTVVEGPEVELSSYNFDKLRIPENHPARDMWDTFWIDRKDESMLLRTHTSPMQIRYMETHEPPIRVAVPGRCYRYEATDMTHEWMLQQVELLAIDKDVSLADLKGTLHEFARQIFGSDSEVMLRNSYFPFVEPGVELAVKFRGKWLEIMGAGMVHPEIIENAGYNSSVYTGFAAGMGIERIAMAVYEVDDIRHFYTNDLRFLSQF
ncbi:MAG: phenylalanine--tRNA ligase subunit alpha [Chloroflexi bacterium]|nr:phenylalanine--tRNA ligase subunit alpha [Chloroflexota bacterium]|tara:strand:+ start:12160 stop:13161 length:1002 start_codon:yes stop_codon:yes gene_type:complete